MGAKHLELEQHIFRSAVQGLSVSVSSCFLLVPSIIFVLTVHFQGVTQIRGG